VSPATRSTTTSAAGAAPAEGGRAPHALRGVRRPASRAPRAAARPAARAGTRATTRAAAPVAPGRGRGRARTLLLCGAVLVASLLVALLTNIALSRGSYTEHALQAEQTLLAEQEQALTEHLQQVSSPGAVDERAQQLGMVRAPQRAWLVLQAPQEQAVVGSPSAAPTPTPSASGTAPGGDARPSSTATPSSSAAAAEQGAVDTDPGDAGDDTGDDIAAGRATASATAPSGGRTP
jgi:hypothetical protein